MTPQARRARHPMPPEVLAALESHGLKSAYDARPPYQRNDYLGWIARAKRDATKAKRMEQMLAELKAGDSYMKMPYRAARPAPGGAG